MYSCLYNKKMEPEFLNVEPLDRQIAVPLYYQIQQRLLQQIRSGLLKPGGSLPSEQAIAEHFRVSRMTGRHALKSLCDLGVTFTLRGKGTFVSGIKLEKNFRQLTSYTEDMQARGLQPGSKVLSFEIIRPDRDAATALRCSLRETVISLRRVRLADGSPMAIEWSRIPHRRCPDLVKNFDPHTSLYETLAQQYGLRVAFADEIAEAGLTGPEEARLLGVATKSPVFLFTRISYLPNGEPIEFVKSAYRADRYKIVSRLKRLNRELLSERDQI